MTNSTRSICCLCFSAYSSRGCLCDSLIIFLLLILHNCNISQPFDVLHETNFLFDCVRSVYLWYSQGGRKLTFKFWNQRESGPFPFLGSIGPFSCQAATEKSPNQRESGPFPAAPNLLFFLLAWVHSGSYTDYLSMYFSCFFFCYIN